MENNEKTLSVAWEAMENARTTQVFRGHQLKTKRKHMFLMGTYGKRMENTGVA